MKSDEDFLKGVYEKADYVREQEKIQPIKKRYVTNRVIRYTTGIAACFLCGIMIVKGLASRNPQEEVPKVSQRTGEPMTASMDSTQLLDCKISKVVLTDGVATIEAVILNDSKKAQEATICMIAEKKLSWMTPETEVLFSV